VAYQLLLDADQQRDRHRRLTPRRWRWMTVTGCDESDSLSHRPLRAGGKWRPNFHLTFNPDGMPAAGVFSCPGVTDPAQRRNYPGAAVHPVADVSRQAVASDDGGA
jgi:hypothetical protein